MKKIIISFLLSALLVSCVHKHEECREEELPPIQKTETATDEIVMFTATQFVEGSKDVPLAGSLIVISDDDLGFDSTSGSVVVVAYKSNSDLQKVRDFYLKNLPQLGWSLKKETKNNLKFKRDNEHLEIEFSKNKSGNSVKFFIESAAK